MAETCRFAAMAEDYLLGRLTNAERRLFENRLQQSAELRTLVRDLEDGLVVLAMSAPQHAAPRTAWPQIRAAVGRSSWLNLWSSFGGFKWMLGGWGVAGGVTAILLLHGFWQQPATPSAAPVARISRQVPDNPVPVSSSVRASAALNLDQKVGPPALTDHQFPLATTHNDDSQPEAVRPNGEPVQFSPVASVVAKAPKQQPLAQGNCAPFCKARLSPKARQAILLAAAHQLGLNHNTSPDSGNAGADGSQESPDDNPPEIVGLTVPPRSSSSPFDGWENRDPTMAGRSPASPAGVGSSPADTAPMFSPSQYVVPVDASGLPPGTPVIVWQMDADGNLNIVGVFRLQNNPTVVIAITDLQIPPEQPYFFVTAGVSNTIVGQFPP